MGIFSVSNTFASLNLFDPYLFAVSKGGHWEVIEK